MNTIKSQIAAVLVAVALLAECGNPDDGPNAKRSGQEPNSDDPALGPGAMRAGQAPLGMPGSGSPDSGASNPTNSPSPSLTDARMPNSPSQPDAGPTGSILDALLGTDARPTDTSGPSSPDAKAPTIVKNPQNLIPGSTYFLTTKDEIAVLTGDDYSATYIGCPSESNIYNPNGSSRWGRVDLVVPLRLVTRDDVIRLNYRSLDFSPSKFLTVDEVAGRPLSFTYQYKYKPCP